MFGCMDIDVVGDEDRTHGQIQEISQTDKFNEELHGW